MEMKCDSRRHGEKVRLEHAKCCDGARGGGICDGDEDELSGLGCAGIQAGNCGGKGLV